MNAFPIQLNNLSFSRFKIKPLIAKMINVNTISTISNTRRAPSSTKQSIKLTAKNRIESTFKR